MNSVETKTTDKTYAVKNTHKQEWETPQGLFDDLNKEYGFTLDAAASDKNHKCKKYYTERVDGLLQDWKGETVFCNPPTGHKSFKLWVRKAYEESRKKNTTVVMLLPVSTDSDWFQRYIYGQQGVRVKFLPARIKMTNPYLFIDSENRKETIGSRRPSMIVEFTNKKRMSLKAKYDEYFGKSGKLINFMYKDIPFEITVKHVFVYPQGFSITAASEIQKEIKRYPRSYVVDIGGYTTDVIRFSGRGNTYAPDLSFCESYDRGVIELLSTVESELRVHCSLSVDDYMAEAILAGNNNMLVDENAVKIAKETADNYATALIRTISEKIKDDFKTSYFIFMGGGSAMMRESIERAIDTKNLFFLTDVTANAKGYEIMARAKLTMSGEI